MDTARAAFHPNPTLDRDGQIRMQYRVARTARFQDPVGRPPHQQEESVIAGVDQAFVDDDVVSAVVAMREGEVIERVTARRPIRMPYVPGLLSFREGEAVVAALAELEITPDVLICDGNGRIHPRQAGLATHLGVLFDVPSVGVAKALLCGRIPGSVDEPMEQGRRERIEADENVSPVRNGDRDWPTVGMVYQSRQFADTEDRHVNPIYVSPGHRVSAGTAVDIVAETCEGYKLPEPIRLADSLAAQGKGKD